MSMGLLRNKNKKRRKKKRMKITIILRVTMRGVKNRKMGIKTMRAQ
jgi:hypothetical protein